MLDTVTQANVAHFTSVADRYQDEEPHFRPENIRHVHSALCREQGPHLDIGCGTGFIQNVLWPVHECSVGIDVTMAMLRRNTHAKARASAFELPFPDGTFGLVTAYAVLHHMRSPVHALCEALRVLRTGGVLWTGLDPNAEWLPAKFGFRSGPFAEDRVKFLKGEREDEPHHAGFTSEWLCATLRDLGARQVTTRLVWFKGQADCLFPMAVDAYLQSMLPLTEGYYKYIEMRAVK